MKFVILATGTRGDVQPFVALAQGLRAAGHEAVLAAGKPTLVCPATTDQPFWGRVVHQLGVGPAPIPRRQLTAERLAEAVRAATGDPEMQRRAAALGEAIRAEDGVAQAVAEILRRVGALAG